MCNSGTFQTVLTSFLRVSSVRAVSLNSSYRATAVKSHNLCQSLPTNCQHIKSFKYREFQDRLSKTKSENKANEKRSLKNIIRNNDVFHFCDRKTLQPSLVFLIKAFTTTERGSCRFVVIYNIE